MFLHLTLMVCFKINFLLKDSEVLPNTKVQFSDSLFIPQKAIQLTWGHVHAWLDSSLDWTAVQLSSFQSLDRLGHRGTRGTIRQRSCSSLLCRRPLCVVLGWADKPTLWCCPSSIFSADHGVAHPPRCPEGWFWRGCHDVWHARTMQVSVSWQLPEEVPVDPQGSWSYPAPSNDYLITLPIH